MVTRGRLGRLIALPAVLAAATGLASVPANAAGKTPTNVTLTYLTHIFAPANALTKQLIAQWEAKHPGVHVNYIDVTSGTTYTKFLTLTEAGDAPDIYDMANAYGPALMSKHVLAPVDYKALGVKGYKQLTGEFLGGALEGYVWQGQLYGVPHQFSNYVAWYNTAEYKAAHLSLPTTWQQVEADAAKLTIKDHGAVKQEELAFPVNYPAASVLILDAMASEAGQPLFNAAGTKSYIDSSASIKAFTTLNELVNKYHAVYPGLEGTQITGGGNQYRPGIAAMELGAGSWQSGILQSQYPKTWKVAAAAPYPTYPGHAAVSDDYGYALVVPAASKHQALAWSLVNYLNSKTAAVDYLKIGLYTGLKAANNTPAAHHIKFWESVFVPTLAHGHYLPNLINGTQIMDIVGKAQDEIILDHANIQATLKSAYEQIVPLLNPPA